MKQKARLRLRLTSAGEYSIATLADLSAGATPRRGGGGEGGIRTPGPVKVNGFQDRRDRPALPLLQQSNRNYSFII